jgi:hypothetical protein
MHIRDLIEPWNQHTELLDDLGVERILEQQLPPARRYEADRLHRLLFEISDLIRRAEIDDHLETLEIMLEDGLTGPPRY